MFFRFLKKHLHTKFGHAKLSTSLFLKIKNTMNKQNAFRRGFTLIELMIVIVILGILMGTILPRLTGAQARARDTARKADLTNISQALEVYYGDTGQYPDAGATPCLYDGGGTPANENSVYTALKGYMKGNRVPQAISASQITLTSCVGS